MRNLSILAKNGRYKNSPTIGLNSAVRCHHWWSQHSKFQLLFLKLEAQGAYPLLLGRPWLRTANIKQNWRKNTLTFRKGKAKIRVSTQAKVATKKDSMPLYAESVNMMERLDDGEVNQYFEENSKIIPLFKIEVVDIITPYISNEEKETDIFDTEETLDDKPLRELRR